MIDRSAWVWKLDRDPFEEEPGRIGWKCDNIVTHQFSPKEGDHEGHLIEVTEIVQYRVTGFCYACREYILWIDQ